MKTAGPLDRAQIALWLQQVPVTGTGVPAMVVPASGDPPKVQVHIDLAPLPPDLVQRLHDRPKEVLRELQSLALELNIQPDRVATNPRQTAAENLQQLMSVLRQQIDYQTDRRWGSFSGSREQHPFVATAVYLGAVRGGDVHAKLPIGLTVDPELLRSAQLGAVPVLLQQIAAGKGYPREILELAGPGFPPEVAQQLVGEAYLMACRNGHHVGRWTSEAPAGVSSEAELAAHKEFAQRELELVAKGALAERPTDRMYWDQTVPLRERLALLSGLPEKLGVGRPEVERAMLDGFVSQFEAHQPNLYAMLAWYLRGKPEEKTSYMEQHDYTDPAFLQRLETHVGPERFAALITEMAKRLRFQSFPEGDEKRLAALVAWAGPRIDPEVAAHKEVRLAGVDMTPGLTAFIAAHPNDLAGELAKRYLAKSHLFEEPGGVGSSLEWIVGDLERERRIGVDEARLAQVEVLEAVAALLPAGVMEPPPPPAQGG